MGYRGKRHESAVAQDRHGWVDWWIVNAGLEHGRHQGWRLHPRCDRHASLPKSESALFDADGALPLHAARHVTRGLRVRARSGALNETQTMVIDVVGRPDLRDKGLQAAYVRCPRCEYAHVRHGCRAADR